MLELIAHRRDVKVFLAKSCERMRENGLTITRQASPVLAAKFKAPARGAVAEWEAKSGAEGREVVGRFRRY